MHQGNRAMIYVHALAVLCLLGAGLSVLLLIAQRVLANYGPCAIRVNDREPFFVEGGRTLLDALTEGRVFIPSACGGQGTCGYCRLRVLAGGGPVLFTELPHLSGQEIAAGWRLACQVKVRGDLAVWVRPDYLDVRQYRGTLVAARMLTHDTRELRVRLDEPGRIEFRAGQYVQVAVPAEEGLEYRAYSISSPPQDAGEIEWVVRLVPGGVGSTYLHRVQVGEQVVFTGPYGDFSLDTDPAIELVCIGGGCGLAPIRSIVHALYAADPDARCRLFFGARTAADVFYREQFEALARRRPGLEVHYALSEPAHGGPWDGHTGLIHQVVDACLPPGGRRQAFVCGPEAMIHAVERVLREKGVPADRIYYEELFPAAKAEQLGIAMAELVISRTLAAPHEPREGGGP
jgi:Na+-transporting NADH:ubiquinone oxidoreductase subunit F